jgi:hypothetical protein
VEGRRRSAQGAMSHAGRVAAGAGSSEPRAGSARHGGAGRGGAGRGRAGHGGAGPAGQGGAGSGSAGRPPGKGGARSGRQRGRQRGARSSINGEEQHQCKAPGWARKRWCCYFKNLTSERVESARRKLTGRGPVRSRKKPYARSAA